MLIHSYDTSSLLPSTFVPGDPELKIKAFRIPGSIFQSRALFIPSSFGRRHACLISISSQSICIAECDSPAVSCSSLTLANPSQLQSRSLKLSSTLLRPSSPPSYAAPHSTRKTPRTRHTRPPPPRPCSQPPARPLDPPRHQPSSGGSARIATRRR